MPVGRDPFSLWSLAEVVVPDDEPAPSLDQPRSARGRRVGVHRRGVRRFHGAGSAFVLTMLAVGTVGATPVGAATGYSRDVYFAAGYERQVDTRTCTAASTAMMMDFLARRDLNLGQLAILGYEQPRDALNDAIQRGSDPLGWSRAATYFSRYTPRPTTYRWEAFDTATAALHRAAVQLSLTGKPVGLLVLHGRHAIVMTGVTASADPATDPATLTSIAVSDPYGYSHVWVAVASSPLNSYLEMDATPTFDAAWYGKYVVIVPQS